jgi:3-deoxy-D-manno-octulosonate 8-phosphate phosphatase (KDO 8-P phosphatase)
MTCSHAELIERARRIRAIVLDVDGVLTDGTLTYDRDGDALRTFFVRDGSALKLAMREGLGVAILSGKTSEAVALRAAELGISPCLQGHRRKEPAWETLIGQLALQESAIAFMGDDFLDLAILRRAGLATVPADASPEAIEAAHWIAGHAGGRGAVRDLVELILRARGTWEQAVERDLARD